MKAFLERKQMYTIETIEYGNCSMDEFLELVEEGALITFEDTAQKEPAEEGRPETTATEQGTPEEAVEKPKQAKRGRPKKWSD